MCVLCQVAAATAMQTQTVLAWILEEGVLEFPAASVAAQASVCRKVKVKLRWEY